MFTVISVVTHSGFFHGLKIEKSYFAAFVWTVTHLGSTIHGIKSFNRNLRKMLHPFRYHSRRAKTREELWSFHSPSSHSPPREAGRRGRVWERDFPTPSSHSPPREAGRRGRVWERDFPTPSSHSPPREAGRRGRVWERDFPTPSSHSPPREAGRRGRVWERDFPTPSLGVIYSYFCFSLLVDHMGRVPSPTLMEGGGGGVEEGELPPTLSGGNLCKLV